MTFDPRVSRRGFCRGVLAGGTALALSAGTTPAADNAGKPASGKIGDFKISLAEWSIHKALFNKDVAEKEFGREIHNLDFPRIAREQFGIAGVEFVNQFFKDRAHDPAYLKDLKTRADDQGVTCALIMIDGEGDLSAQDAKGREQAVENHKKWVDAAAALGCHAIRVNTGHGYSARDVGQAPEACRKLAEYGATHRIEVICENHGGPSSDPDALLALIKAVDVPTFGTLPDFGNFPRKDGQYAIDVYGAIARMMPYARGVSAKSYDFDGHGNETTLDYARILKIVSDAGYRGFVGIEYEGGRLSEPEGIRATKTLLERLRGAEYRP
jgi:L-ribulose-5-phosphate 3-epimerase